MDTRGRPAAGPVPALNRATSLLPGSNPFPASPPWAPFRRLQLSSLNLCKPGSSPGTGIFVLQFLSDLRSPSSMLPSPLLFLFQLLGACPTNLSPSTLPTRPSDPLIPCPKSESSDAHVNRAPTAASSMWGPPWVSPLAPRCSPWVLELQSRSLLGSGHSVSASGKCIFFLNYNLDCPPLGPEVFNLPFVTVPCRMGMMSKKHQLLLWTTHLTLPTVLGVCSQAGSCPAPLNPLSHL